LARVTKETNEIQKRFWKKEGMVDFNTKREVTVEKKFRHEPVLFVPE